MSVDLTLKQGSNLPLKRGWWGGGLTGVSLTNPLPKNPGRNAAPHPNGLAVGLLREREERRQDIREREGERKEDRRGVERRRRKERRGNGLRGGT